MKDFTGRIAVITGAGTGIGRELARQLVSEGCHVAICDVLIDNLNETEKLCRQAAAKNILVTTHECDVADENQVIAFCDSVKKQHNTDHINLLFNNAGVGGGGSFLMDERNVWDRVFNINWFGVYFCTRSFLPLLVASQEGHIINISSINGFWACMGPMVSHTAYSSSKFAVKGFTEALQIDLRINAPHVKASVVMPGHIGTDIAINSTKVLGGNSVEEMTSEELAQARGRMQRAGVPTEGLSDEELRALIKQFRDDFRDNAPMTPAQAAAVILDGVRNEQWRILVGEDAQFLDQMVRENPETAYEISFAEMLIKEREKRGVDKRLNPLMQKEE
ncbi:MAG: SDR family oxidoreductase [Desulfobacterales bacterium]|nr:SDR family oxidoreductase [Desulfobacterales bacterium]